MREKRKKEKKDTLKLLGGRRQDNYDLLTNLGHESHIPKSDLP